MPPGRRSKFWSSIALALALALPAHADPPDPKDEVAAKKEFSVGEKAFDKGDYLGALDHFKKAFELLPRDAVRFNIGVCLERLGRFKEATDEYEAAAKSDELDTTKRERASSEAARVRGRLGTLKVAGKNQGADVFVDGTRACALPCEILLDPRAHQIVLRKDSMEKSESVTLKSGETTELAFDPPSEAKPVPPPPVTKPKERAAPPSSHGPGVLTWIGGGMALAGTAGFIGFGLRARKLESDYDDKPTESTRNEGRTMGTLTNVSLGVAVAGVALVAVDLLFLSKGNPSSARRVRAPVISF